MNKLVKRLAAFLVPILWSVTTMHAHATPIVLPTGLNPGDEYRLAFVTSTTPVNAFFNDINVYNEVAELSAEAIPELAALQTNWYAIASTSDIDARDNTLTNPGNAAHKDTAIYLLNGTRLATGNSDLWDGSIENPLNIDEYGNQLNQAFVWTGTNPDGTGSSLALGSGSGALMGYTATTFQNWISFGESFADNERHFYVMSGLLTVPNPANVPEPNMLGLLLLSSVLVLAHRRRRGRQHLKGFT